MYATVRRCSLPGCDAPVLAREWCSKHYQRWAKYGDPVVSKNPLSGLGVDERFELRGWDEVPGSLDTPCWEFRGAADKDGYKRIKDGGKTIKAHRFAYETWVGPIPDNLIVRHKCDNPPCINPEHLVPGTVAENHRDREERGHSFRGEGSGNAKLTWGAVDEIRVSDEPRADLAKRYGVQEAAIYKVQKGLTWIR